MALKNWSKCGVQPATWQDMVIPGAGKEIAIVDIEIINRALEDAKCRIDLFDANPAQALSTPSGLTVTPQGSAGSTTYSYRVSALNERGETLACSAVQITNGNSTLDNTNYNHLTWDAVSGATAYRVYGRTAGAEVFMAEVTTNSYDDKGNDNPDSDIPPPWINDTNIACRIIPEITLNAKKNSSSDNPYTISMQKKIFLNDNHKICVASNKAYVDFFASGDES